MEVLSIGSSILLAIKVRCEALTCHGRADVILLFVGLYHVVHAALKNVLHNLVGYNSLNHNALATAQDPTYNRYNNQTKCNDSAVPSTHHLTR